MDDAVMRALMSRRRALRLMAAGAGAAILIACGNDDETDETPPAATSAPGSTPAPQPTTDPSAARSGGMFRLGSTGDLTRLDPQYREQFHRIVFDQLTDYDDAGVPQPMLAETWDVSDDFTQVRFALRQGVVFHNGRDFTSEDVKFSYERARDLEDTNLLEAQWFASIETPDPYTVVMTLDQPRPMAFDAFFGIPIVAKEMYDSDGNATSAIGTGAFKLANWSQGTEQAYEKNESYWKSGQPYFDELIVSVVSDLQALGTRLEAGALDATSVSSPDFLRFQNDPNFTALLDFSAGIGQCMGVNVNVPPWDNKTARQAVQHAIDRKHWADTIYRGLAAPSASNWPSGSPAWEESAANAYPYDLDKARELLAEAGVTGPVSQQLMYATGSQERDDFAQVFQADMADIGIDLELVPVDIGVLRERANAGEYEGFYMTGLCCQHLDPGSGLTKSRIVSPTRNNSGPYMTERYSAIVDKVLTTTDPAARQEAFKEYNEIFLDESFVYVLGHSGQTLATTNAVKGLRGIRTQLGGSWTWSEGYFET